MGWSLTPARRDEMELMDAPGLPVDEVVDAYRVLRRVNRQLGNLRTIERELHSLLEGAGTSEDPVTLLDVGSGSGDIPLVVAERLARRPFAVRALALDRDPMATALARSQGLDVVRGDALWLPFADHSVDLVTAVKFAHHFSGPALTRLIAEMARVARRGVVVLDIRRNWLAYGGFIAWSRIFTTNRLVRADGPLSVLRGFTRDEFEALAEPLDGFTWTVRGHLGFQLALVGRRTKDTMAG